MKKGPKYVMSGIAQVFFSFDEVSGREFCLE